MTHPELPTPQLPAGRLVPADDVPAEPAPVSLRELAADADPDEVREEAGLPGQVIHVRLEDGTEFDVSTTNRDYLRWDKTPPARRGGVQEFQKAPFLFATFLAWAAAHRQGLTALTFDQFAELAVTVERRQATEVPPTR